MASKLSHLCMEQQQHATKCWVLWRERHLSSQINPGNASTIAPRRVLYSYEIWNSLYTPWNFTVKRLHVSSTHTTTCRLAALSSVTSFNLFTKPADSSLHGAKINFRSNLQVSHVFHTSMSCSVLHQTSTLGNQTVAKSPSSRVSLRCNTAHHAEYTSAGLFRLLPGPARPLSPSAPSPSVNSFSPLSQPSSTGPPQGLTLRDIRGEGGESRKSSPWGGVNVRKGVVELGLGG